MCVFFVTKNQIYKKKNAPCFYDMHTKGAMLCLFRPLNYRKWRWIKTTTKNNIYWKGYNNAVMFHRPDLVLFALLLFALTLSEISIKTDFQPNKKAAHTHKHYKNPNEYNLWHKVSTILYSIIRHSDAKYSTKAGSKVRR